MKQFFRSLFSIWSTDVSDTATTDTATPAPVVIPTVASPATPGSDKTKAVVDAVFEAAKFALRHRPIMFMTVVAADAAIDALWDKIFPPAQVALTAKGISV